MNNYFPQYTTDYISGVMSLRKPQEQSLKILEDIVNSVMLRKGMNLKARPRRLSARQKILCKRSSTKSEMARCHCAQ
jgi:hypothetical protein